MGKIQSGGLLKSKRERERERYFQRNVIDRKRFKGHMVLFFSGLL